MINTRIYHNNSESGWKSSTDKEHTVSLIFMLKAADFKVTEYLLTVKNAVIIFQFLQFPFKYSVKT